MGDLVTRALTASVSSIPTVYVLLIGMLPFVICFPQNKERKKKKSTMILETVITLTKSHTHPIHTTL